MTDISMIAKLTEAINGTIRTSGPLKGFVLVAVHDDVVEVAAFADDELMMAVVEAVGSTDYSCGDWEVVEEEVVGHA